MLVLYWTRTNGPALAGNATTSVPFGPIRFRGWTDGDAVEPPAPTPSRQQPAGEPGPARKRQKGRRKVIIRDKVYEVAESAIPSLLRALVTTGQAERVIRKVKRGAVVKTVEEWKPVTHKLQVALDPFQFYEPMQQEFAARADEYMLAALESVRRELMDEEDTEILALFL